MKKKYGAPSCDANCKILKRGEKKSRYEANESLADESSSYAKVKKKGEELLGSLEVESREKGRSDSKVSVVETR